MATTYLTIRLIGYAGSQIGRVLFRDDFGKKRYAVGVTCTAASTRELYVILKRFWNGDESIFGEFVPKGATNSKLSEETIKEVRRIALELQGFVSADREKTDFRGQYANACDKNAIIVLMPKSFDREVILPNVGLVLQKTLNACPLRYPICDFLQYLQNKVTPRNSPFTTEETEKLVANSNSTKDSIELLLPGDEDPKRNFPVRVFPCGFFGEMQLFDGSQLAPLFSQIGSYEQYLVVPVSYEYTEQMYLLMNRILGHLNSFFVNVTFVALPYLIESLEPVCDNIFFPIGNGTTDLYRMDDGYQGLLRDVLRLKQRYAPRNFSLVTLIPRIFRRDARQVVPTRSDDGRPNSLLADNSMCSNSPESQGSKDPVRGPCIMECPEERVQRPGVLNHFVPDGTRWSKSPRSQDNDDDNL